MAEIRQLAADSLPKVKRDHALESHLAEFEIRERSILQAVVNGLSVSKVASAFDVASYRVRKLVEASLSSLGLVTLEQLQLRYLTAGLVDDI
jgi:DNA-binding NarL/FixJ family response regulator